MQKTEKISPNEQVRFIGNTNGVNYINISKQRTILEVKKDLKEIIGLTAEVYRKSGNVWIETF